MTAVPEVVSRGIPQHRDVEGAIPPTPTGSIDEALADLLREKNQWAQLPIVDRLAILRELRKDFTAVAARWAEACRVGEGIPAGTPTVGEEWLAGPYFILRNLRLLEVALGEIESQGRPKIPGPVSTRADGQVVAQVFPQSIYDQLLFTGVTGEVWMDPQVTHDRLAETQALAYQEDQVAGEISLVLGAGNVSSIGPMDALYKLFVEKKVVIYKLHPLNAYLGPILAEGFQALIDWGVLRLVYGGVETGAYLCEHEAVDEIHITGSDKTVEAIVFGSGEEGQERKSQKKPKNTKAISSELGNVSPVIVVPGPWSSADIAYQAQHLVAMLVNNAGFNCNATRVIVTHAGWDGRGPLLDAVRRELAKVPLRHAYYPGAEDRHATFLAAHPEAERYGEPQTDELPWTFLPDLDPEAKDDICFHTEAFCGVFSEVALEADSPEAFVGQAVEFANETLWGTLNASILAHPKSLDDASLGPVIDRATADLRYGTVGINAWAALGYGFVITPWGAYPGHDVYDIQSGSGIVHNTLMFSKVQKTVVRAPFRTMPKPPWFATHKTVDEMAEKLTYFEASPSPLKLPGIVWAAVRG